MKRMITAIAIMLLMINAGAEECSETKPCQITVEGSNNSMLQPSQDITITRQAIKSIQDETVTEITLLIKNNDYRDMQYRITEYVLTNLNYIDAPPAKEKKYEAKTVEYIQWEGTAKAGEEKRITYKIKPTQPGLFTIPPALMLTTFGDYTTNPSTIQVGCKPNNICDKDENYILCPQDCKTGSADDACDYLQDGICDPDCTKEADPDCKETATPCLSSITVIITLLTTGVAAGLKTF